MNWLKKNWKIALIVVGTILIGGVLYEAMVDGVSRRRADTLISDLRADNQRLRDGLEDAQGRVANLKGTVDGLEQGNRELGEQLTASQSRAAELSGINQRLRGENRRLGEALGASEDSAGSISATSRELGESIDRAWLIVDKYSIPTGSE